MSKHLTVVLAFGVLAGSSCASGPPVTADDLKLKRVVIYRNGVAYFEREGRGPGDRVRFKVRGDEVTKRLIQVHMQVKELELRFREAVKLVRIPARA